MGSNQDPEELKLQQRLVELEALAGVDEETTTAEETTTTDTEGPDVTDEGAPDPGQQEAEEDPAETARKGGQRMVPVSELAKLRAKVQELKTQLQERPSREERAQKLEEQFLDNPGETLASVLEQAEQTEMLNRERASIERAIGDLGPEEYWRRYEYLDRYFAENSHEMQTLQAIRMSDPDPAATLMLFAAQLEEQEKWLDPAKRQEAIREEARRLAREELASDLKDRIFEGKGPGVAGAGGRARTEPRLVDQPRHVRLSKSLEELEREAGMDD